MDGWIQYKFTILYTSEKLIGGQAVDMPGVELLKSSLQSRSSITWKAFALQKLWLEQEMQLIRQETSALVLTEA